MIRFIGYLVVAILPICAGGYAEHCYGRYVKNAYLYNRHHKLVGNGTMFASYIVLGALMYIWP